MSDAPLTSRPEEGGEARGCDCIKRVDGALAEYKKSRKVQGRDMRVGVKWKWGKERTEGRVRVCVVRTDGTFDSVMEHGLCASFCPFCGRKYGEEE